MAVNGIALAAIAGGSIFLYSAIKGKSILATSQAIITGQSPATAKQANPIQPVLAPNPAANVGGSFGIQSSALPSSGTYDHASLMTLWTQAGGSASTANNAACHAMQESSGNPLAESNNPDGGKNIGLWQLDTKGVGSGYSISTLQNAMNNARITVLATKNGTDWSQWATPGC